MRIFIADDSKLVRDRLVAMLAGFRGIESIEQAQNAQQAIEGIQRLEPDVVILDIRMPGGNGIEVLKTIKKRGFAGTIIIFTQYPYPQYRNRCMKAGANFFFDKSKEFKNIKGVIEQLLGHSS